MLRVGFRGVLPLYARMCTRRVCLSSRVGPFFFDETPTTEIYTLSLHDALPISSQAGVVLESSGALLSKACTAWRNAGSMGAGRRDRKSTRLNSSHVKISYAVFCLKKKKNSVESVRRRRSHREARP